MANPKKIFIFNPNDKPFGPLSNLFKFTDDFLVNNGIIIRQTNLKSLAQADYSSILDNQLYRLIAKEQMGEIFKVMEYTSF